MTRRVKWLRMKTSIDLSELSKFFYSKKFSLNSEYGFLDVESKIGSTNATYVEMEETTQEYIDPLGEKHEQTLVIYNIFNFEIKPLEKGVFLLSITNPPRNIKKFIDRISSSFDYNITFSTADLYLNNIIDKLSSSKDFNLFRINKLKASNLKLNNNSMACIEVISKDNALQDIEVYANGSKYTIDKIKGNMFFKEKKISFEMTKSGLVSINDDEFDLDTLTNVIFF